MSLSAHANPAGTAAQEADATTCDGGRGIAVKDMGVYVRSGAVCDVQCAVCSSSSM